MIRTVLEKRTRDRRAERRDAVVAEILQAAWELARSEGLAGLSLRDLAARIGMRPSSLYWYFDSKRAIYDAMFVQGNQQLLSRLAEQHWPEEPRAILILCARLFVEFSKEDIQRYQLLFQRTIPNFEPSPEAYAVAMQVFEQMRERFAAAGLGGPDAFDIWTALVSGLSAQQTANDPAGDRWLRLIDEVVDMYVDHATNATTKGTGR
jgi:AcrR family transcriptional regulator